MVHEMLKMLGHSIAIVIFSLVSTEAVNSKPHCRCLILSSGKTQTG